MQPTLKSALFPRYTWVSVGDSLWVMDGGVCSLLLLALGPHLVESKPCTPCACCLSLWNSCWFRGPCFLGVLHLFWLLHCFQLFCRVPWVWGEGFDSDTSFMAEGSKVSHSLHSVWLWVSAFAPICCRRKHLWWWPSKALIYEYSRMSLGVLLLLGAFGRTLVVVFPCIHVLSSLGF